MSEHEHIINVTIENFADLVERSRQTPVMFDFWASWCEPCKSLLPIVEKLAVDFSGQFLLAKVNIDEQPELAKQFAVRSVPTVKMVRSGEIVDEFTGALPESQVRAFIERHVETEADRVVVAAQQAYQNGRKAEAEAMLRQALQAEPQAYRLQLTLAEVYAAGGRTDEAEQILAALPAAVGAEPHAQALRARLAFAQTAAEAPDVATLEQALAVNPKESRARYQLAARHVLTGNYETALEQLLELLRRDRSFGDDAARKGMLQIFDMLGADDERVIQYRRRMFTAMH